MSEQRIKIGAIPTRNTTEYTTTSYLTVTFRQLEIVNIGNNVYQSLADDNVGNALTDTSKWVCLVDNDSYIAAEAARQESFTESQAARTEAFNEAEAGRTETFNENEAERQAAIDAKLAEINAMEFDDVPTKNSIKAVKSGGIWKTSPLIKEAVVDFEITDENSNSIVIFSNGDVQTKNFKSAATPYIQDGTPDFEITDENNNSIVMFSGGHVQTKYFNSERLDNTNAWAGKVFSILGDSISTFGVPDQNNAIGTWTYPGNRCRYPQNNLFTNVEYQYWYLLKEKLGMTLGINESWAGSRISNTASTDSGDVGPNRCMSSLTRIGHLGLNGIPDLIIVYGGTNDAGNGVTLGTFDTTNPMNYTEEQIAALPVATFADAYRTMLIRLQYYYPYARILCCFPTYTTSYYTITNLDKYEEIIREACDFFGVEYIDLRTAGVNIYNRATYLPDGIHPNKAGMEMIYNKILKTILY